jgi:hypothetical protein
MPDNWCRNLEHVLSKKFSKSSVSATRGFNSESWCPMFKLILLFGALANWTLIRWYHPLVMEYQVWVSAARQTIWLPAPGTIRFLTFPSKSLLVSTSYSLSSYGTPLPILSSWKLLQSGSFHFSIICTCLWYNTQFLIWWVNCFSLEWFWLIEFRVYSQILANPFFLFQSFYWNWCLLEGQL